MPQKFKPTPAEWRLIKQIALLGHDTQTKPINSVAGVQLECRLHHNVEEPGIECNINAALVTNEDPIKEWADCDLFDKSVELTKQFRAGAELTFTGRGIFDFYIYNRYDRDGDLAGNVLVDVVNGKMDRIWIEGGKSFSWTAEGGVRDVRGRR